ncbi:MAG: hypothetical protein ACKV19_19820 [Verrucomicrobiales bacterium]
MTHRFLPFIFLSSLAATSASAATTSINSGSVGAGFRRRRR